MKEYKKPEVLMTEGMSEKVYMGSGASDGGGDCWRVFSGTEQAWNGSHHIYEIHASHHKEGVKHISSAVDYVFTFESNLTDFYSEFASSFGGNIATVHRELLADAYQSGDEVTFKIWASTGDQATTEALPAPSISWSCTHAVNVQGDYD